MRSIPRVHIQFGIREIGFFLFFLKKGMLIHGDSIELFERAFTDYIGSNYAVSVNSARVGLRLLLESFALAKDAQILVPSYTFHAIPQVTKDMGFDVVFIDSNLDDFNISIDDVKKKITPRSKVIIATHLFGMPCDMDAILALAKEYNLYVIEDCAQALGAEYKGKRVGSLADGAIFSFETMKHINTLGGGMVTINSEPMYQTIKIKRSFCLPMKKTKLIKRVFFTFLESIFTSKLIFRFCVFPLIYLCAIANIDLKTIAKKCKGRIKSFDYSYSNYQAWLGYLQMSKLSETIQKRNKNAESILETSSLFSKQVKKEQMFPSYYYSAIRAKNPETMHAYLIRNGIDAVRYFMKNTARTYEQDHRCPHSETLEKEIILLPVHLALHENERNHLQKVLSGKW